MNQSVYIVTSCEKRILIVMSLNYIAISQYVPGKKSYEASYTYDNVTTTYSRVGNMKFLLTYMKSSLIKDINSDCKTHG